MTSESDNESVISDCAQSQSYLEYVPRTPAAIWTPDRNTITDTNDETQNGNRIVKCIYFGTGGSEDIYTSSPEPEHLPTPGSEYLSTQPLGSEIGSGKSFFTRHSYPSVQSIGSVSTPSRKQNKRGVPTSPSDSAGTTSLSDSSETLSPILTVKWVLGSPGKERCLDSSVNFVKFKKSK